METKKSIGLSSEFMRQERGMRMEGWMEEKRGARGRSGVEKREKDDG